MATIENFYHTCWLTLKARHPELRGDLDSIEFEVAGLAVELFSADSPPEEDDGNDEPIPDII